MKAFLCRIPSSSLYAICFAAFVAIGAAVKLTLDEERAGLQQKLSARILDSTFAEVLDRGEQFRSAYAESRRRRAERLARALGDATRHSAVFLDLASAARSDSARIMGLAARSSYSPRVQWLQRHASSLGSEARHWERCSAHCLSELAARLRVDTLAEAVTYDTYLSSLRRDSVTRGSARADGLSDLAYTRMKVRSGWYVTATLLTVLLISGGLRLYQVTLNAPDPRSAPDGSTILKTTSEFATVIGPGSPASPSAADPTSSRANLATHLAVGDAAPSTVPTTSASRPSALRRALAAPRYIEAGVTSVRQLVLFELGQAALASASMRLLAVIVTILPAYAALAFHRWGWLTMLPITGGFVFLSTFRVGREQFDLVRRLGVIHGSLAGTIDSFTMTIVESEEGLSEKEVKHLVVGLLARIRRYAELFLRPDPQNRLRATVAVPIVPADGTDPTELRVWCYDEPYENRRWTQLSLDKPGSPEAFRTGSIATIDDIEKLPEHQRVGTHAFRSVMCLPVQLGGPAGKSLAVVSIDSTTPDFFGSKRVVRFIPLVMPILNLMALVLLAKTEDEPYEFR